MTSLPLRLSEEVSDAIASGVGVVALESTLISHGLPRETSARTALEIEGSVRREGAVPATVAVIDGTIHVGLSDAQVAALTEGDRVVKASVRDLGPVMSQGLTGATTVAATAYLAHLAGIRVFATGGLGGVHRGADETWDESADLVTLASVPVTVVCAGVKSLLDVPATLERLESLSVTVVGYGTDVFPGFYVRDSGLPVPWRLDTVQEVAAVVRHREALAVGQAMVVANPIDTAAEMDPREHDRILAEALAAAQAKEVRGKDVTPFLLAYFHERSHGASLAANIALVLSNARLAARIAAAL